MLGFLAHVALGAPSVDCHAVGMSCASVYLTRDGTVASVVPATLDPAAAAWGEAGTPTPPVVPNHRDPRTVLS